MCDETQNISPHTGVGTYEVHEAPGVLVCEKTGKTTDVTIPYVAFRPATVVTAGPTEIALAEGVNPKVHTPDADLVPPAVSC